MKNVSPIVLILVASLALSACSHQAATCNPSTLNEHSQGLRDLRSLRPGRATEDAANAYAGGDARLLAVYGYSVEVPGYNGDPYAHKDKISMLDGTGDAFCTKEEADLNHNARAYARKYNETMLSKLKQAGVYLDALPDAHR